MRGLMEDLRLALELRVSAVFDAFRHGLRTLFLLPQTHSSEPLGKQAGKRVGWLAGWLHSTAPLGKQAGKRVGWLAG